MGQSGKYFFVIGILLIGASGKLLNGPWLINRLFPIAPGRVKGQGLSPVIFSELIFCTIFFYLAMTFKV